MDEDATGCPGPDLYYTTEACTTCGAEARGLHGRWTCTACGTSAPYSPPPEGWQADPGYLDPPKL